MSQTESTGFSRRESQIMDVIYRLGKASAEEVRAELSDKPGLSSIRKLLYVLETKGHLKHEEEGKTNIYSPTVPLEQARVDSLRHLMSTFFGGSARRVVSTLLEEENDLTEEDLRRIAALADEESK